MPPLRRAASRHPGPRSARRSSGRSATELHQQWLELVDTEGPFLALPALKRIYPQGIPALDANALLALKDARGGFDAAWERWDAQPDDDTRLVALRTARDFWVEIVLRNVAGWGDLMRWADHGGSGSGLGSGLDTLRVQGPGTDVVVTPSAALVRSDLVGALVLVVEPRPGESDLRQGLDDGWSDNSIDRMEALLHQAGVPIGVVTDGRWWALVCARAGALAASGITDSQTWVEEPEVRNAFLQLIGRRRLVGGDEADRLPQLFAESVAAAEEITEALGVQVRRAVELLVAAFSENAIEARRRGQGDPLPADRDEVYQAAVTVMMRVVFLLFAQECGLLPQSDLFTAGYGLVGQLDVLDERARHEYTEPMDATFLTWHRLLATSQGLYAGATFENLRMPAYGGSLFDPGRFGFLLARREDGALRIQISDRVMLEVLRAVQQTTIKGQDRRISFRDIDVEQIGYIYEGLLGYSCTDVHEVTVGLIGVGGAEPEITMTDLEDLAEHHRGEASLADAVIASVKVSQPAARPTSKAALAKALRTSSQVEDAERALLAVTDAAPLRARLRPFIGAIRRDLRNRPVVIEPGGLVVVETPSRATAGAHYTPRALAEEVVEHALAPLVYRPGPHQQPDGWKLLSSDRILELRVADIACGSGAFLVAAARYLAARLAEAWRREGVATGSPDELRTKAIRQVVATCLYGADINPMAIEMCKLSLWLVSLDPHLPFSFVDDKVLHGNSLLGLIDRRQLEALHITPTAQSQLALFGDRESGLLAGRGEALDVEEVLRHAAALRRRLASEVSDDDPARSATTKRRLWAEYQASVATLSHIADGVVAAGLHLGGKPGKALTEAYENLRISVETAYPATGSGDSGMLDSILDAGLTPTVITDYERWKPLHWFLAVPDVMANGGFDAVVGNPPFVPGKEIAPSSGSNYREWLVHQVASGKRGSADLLVYFLLRAWIMLSPRGSLAIIGSNSLPQGENRTVGLLQILEQGGAAFRAIQSRPWPASSADVEYSAVWLSKDTLDSAAERQVDGNRVSAIDSFLEPAGRIEGEPHRLVENLSKAFVGCNVNGTGFRMPEAVAHEMLRHSPLNNEVLREFAGGEHLTEDPRGHSGEWVVDFFGMSEQQARAYSEPYEWVREKVLPHRQRLLKKPKLQREWWLYERNALNLRNALRANDLSHVLAITLTSKTLMPLRIASNILFSHSVGVFVTDSYCDQAVYSSAVHQLWATRHGSSLRNDARYTPSVVFGTLPRPHPTTRLSSIGMILDEERREIMLRSERGLTKLYNFVNHPDVRSDADVARLREIHVELDESVMEAYGWSDIALNHGFHTYRQTRRWTVSPAARVEILDRLLEENHRRAAAQGEAPRQSDDPDIDDDGPGSLLREEGAQ